MLLFVYIIVCFLVALLAQKRGHSLFLYFVLSIVLTPFITTLLLFFLIPPKRRFAITSGAADAGAYDLDMAGHHTVCSHCRHQVRQMKTREYCAHCGELL